MNKSSALSRNAVSTIAQVLISAAVMFVLYRYILETLGADQLGIWSIVLATASASRLAELGVSASVTRFVAKYRSRGDTIAVQRVPQTAAISIAVLLSAASFAAFPLLLLLFPKIFPHHALQTARDILPYALASLVLSSVASVFQSSLDGWQRYDKRAALVASSLILYLLLSVLLAPRHELVGLAIAQLAQSMYLLVVGWIVLRTTIGGLPLLPLRWNSGAFREMVAYGITYQVGAVAMLLFDPLTKVLLGRFGSLSTAAYFEMARQFVSKARMLIVAANQVLVPVAADLIERDPMRLRQYYARNIELLYLVALPLFTLVACTAPLVSEIWIGNVTDSFVFFVVLLSFTWMLNTLSGPAYFIQQGTGRIGWNTIGHVLMGVINAALGLTLGPRLGVVGVAAAMAVAFVAGSVFVVYGFHRDHKLGIDPLVPKRSGMQWLFSIAIVCLVLYLHRELLDHSYVLRLSLCLVLPLTLLAGMLAIHPNRGMLQAASPTWLKVFRS